MIPAPVPPEARPKCFDARRLSLRARAPGRVRLPWPRIPSRRNDRRCTAGSDSVMAGPRVTGTVGRDRSDLLVRRDLGKQVRQHPSPVHSNWWHSPAWTSPTLLELTSTARISSVSSSIPRWILRREPCPPLVRGPWRALRFDPPCLRVCHSPSPSTLMPVLSTSRCNGPLEPRNGMTTYKVFCRRERVLKSGTAQPNPESSRMLATKPPRHGCSNRWRNMTRSGRAAGRREP